MEWDLILLIRDFLVTALVMVSYFIGHFMETGEWTITNSAHGITMAFVTMSMAEIFHSMNMRSQRGSIFKLGSKNRLLFGAAAVSCLQPLQCVRSRCLPEHSVLRV